MAAKILLVVKDMERKARFLRKMDELDTAFSVVCSLQEAILQASEEPHCGVLIDMLLMVRVPVSLKASVEGLLYGLPSATLNIHVSSGDIRILTRGATVSECSSIDQFVKVCAGFSPKTIFPKKRESLYFNALLDRDTEFTSAERTACIDISSGGCFLFSVRDDLAIGDTVWIKLVGIGHDYPVKGVVSWIRVWGTTQHIPGIGVNFISVSDELKKTIYEMNR